jgi:YegS C-terminal NAD kinase beta sandwich-like domain
VNGHHRRHFLLMAGLGFDGAVLQHLSKPLKKRIGSLAYAPAALRALRTFHGTPVDVDMDGVRWHGHTAQVVIANTRRYSGFTRISPRAYMDDGLLDVCLLTPDTVLAVSRQISSMLLRQRPSLASAYEHRAAAITIRSQGVLALEVDGGIVHLSDQDLTPEGVVYTFSLTARGVSVLVPRTYDGELFEPQRFSNTLADIPLRPVAAHASVRSDKHNDHNDHASHDGDDGHLGNNGHHRNKDDKVKTWKMKVISVGADSLIAAHVKNGRVVQVEIPPDTMLAGPPEDEDLWGALSALTQGDLVEISGIKDGQHRVLRAQRVALADRLPSHRLRPRKHKH